MGDLSPHFSTSEFRCRHGFLVGPDAHLVKILEAIRSAIARPLPILSGYRCKACNRRVGGARKSLHLLGKAADIPAGLVEVQTALAAGARGIGVRRGWVVHVDTRHAHRPVIFDD